MWLLHDGALIQLNPVAGAVWEWLESARDRQELRRRVRRAFTGVSDQRLAEDLEELLARWTREGWIEIESDPVHPFEPEIWPA